MSGSHTGVGVFPWGESRMTKRSIAACAAAVFIAIAITPIAAGARTRRDAAQSMSSCVDINNDGNCASGTDLPLLGSMTNGVLNTATIPVPPAEGTKKSKKNKLGSVTPPRIGVVIDSVNFAGTVTGGATILASGAIHVKGHVKTANDGYLTMNTSGGDI